MSNSFKLYEKDNTYVLLMWDKNVLDFELYFGVIGQDKKTHTILESHYTTKKESKRKYKEIIRKIKKGENLGLVS